MGKLYRGLCKTIFFFKALLAVILGWALLGYQGYLTYNLYMKSPKPLPPIQIPPPGSQNAQECWHVSSKARLEPPPNAFFWGFSIQWDVDLPERLVQRIGMERAPAIINTFIQMSPNDFQRNMIEWQAQEIQKIGGLMELTLMLTVSPEAIPPVQYAEFAKFMRTINSKYGVPVLLRFMHEMNGPWMIYGMKPKEQLDAWRILSREIRAQTNLTALIWSPNIAGAYPFVGAGFNEQIPRANSPDPNVVANFRLLDTNRDGRLDGADDPYGPYYPDWIGISLYNLARRNGQHGPAAPDTFTSTDSGNVLSLYGGRYPFYPTYVAQKRKPFIFSETGSAVNYNINGQQRIVQDRLTVEHELRTKQSWWTNIFRDSVLAQGDQKLSRLKASVWFEEMKPETSYDNEKVQVLRDYRITFNETVRNQFVTDLQSLGNRITYPGKFKFKCNGDFSFV